ncbi:MAG: proton-conducting transporter membrane subunit [Chloroflexi bacterium]|nr:proton-conducting transporter membrane subunit [Chloroflexota bacterium]
MVTFLDWAPLVILFPLLGFIANLFGGARLGRRYAGWLATGAAALAFVVSLLLLMALRENGYQAHLQDFPLLGHWFDIPTANLRIGWQLRVDTLSVTMMLVVTGVGSLIHLYAIGYMTGDSAFVRFFAYLNLFLVFMLVLVSANNFLMMFVGWEGVGLCSYLLIGFWWDQRGGEGWRNSNAARKAFIVNRVGDFGLLMAMFLIFWQFGTLDFYAPTEVANVAWASGATHHSADDHATDDGHAADANEDEHEAADDHTDSPAGDGHGESGAPAVHATNEHLATHERGVFGQAEALIAGELPVRAFAGVRLSAEGLVTLITLFLLLGAIGKSAQIPLFVWLPDAMAGPTPVSALIHAATMVTAGVYMMVRADVLFYEAAVTSFVVAIIGAATALTAGFIALGQWDIKRVLAYSTISQLGFMVAAVGVGAYVAAMFHLVTHAFFKALLFLGSGSVIHGVEHGHHHVHDAHGVHEGESTSHHEDGFDPQDMRNMGGLAARMPLTYLTYLIGTLALAGVFPLAGFWSKDEILADAWRLGIEKAELSGYLTLGLLLAAAAMTAFYMWRQVELVFHGRARSEAAAAAPESAYTMTVPLLILAVASVLGGMLNAPHGVLGLDRLFGAHSLTNFLEATVRHAHAGSFVFWLAVLALGLAVLAILSARSIYGQGRGVSETGEDALQANGNLISWFWQLANRRLFWDEFYERVFLRPYQALARFFAQTIDWDFWHNYVHDDVLRAGFNAAGGFLARPVDMGLVDGAVNGVARLIQSLSAKLRRTQSGYVRAYALALFLGTLLIVILMLLPLAGSGG